MPKISIIIPCRNAADFIEETIQSIFNQDYPNLECIVMDGVSTDGTLDILKKYEGKIIWKSENDRGQSDAINKGLQLASGDIVTFINADDVYEKDCFEKIAIFFKKNPETKWIYGKCKIIDENGLEMRKLITWYKNYWQKRYSYSRLLMMDFIAQPAAFWRKELTDEIGLFDVNAHLAMEYDYWLRAGAKYDPKFIDEYLARFRLHSQSKSSTRFSEAARDALDIAKRYATANKQNFIVPLQYLNYFVVVLIYYILKFSLSLRYKHRAETIVEMVEKIH